MTTTTWVPPDTFGDRLLRLRRKLHWTVEQAAAVAGVSPASWSSWERGGANPRNMATIVERLSRETSVDRGWLMWGGKAVTNDEKAPRSARVLLAA